MRGPLGLAQRRFRGARHAGKSPSTAMTITSRCCGSRCEYLIPLPVLIGHTDKSAVQSGLIRLGRVRGCKVVAGGLGVAQTGTRPPVIVVEAPGLADAVATTAPTVATLAGSCMVKN